MRAPAMLVLLLAGCASTPQDTVRTQPLAALSQQIAAGATRERARALAEPAQRIVFDSGYEAWLYHYPAQGGIGEYVVLFDPSGVVRKTRTAVVPAPAGPASR